MLAFVLAVLVVILPAKSAAAALTNCSTVKTLAQQKTCQEIRQIEIANSRADSAFQDILDAAPIVTAFVAVIGILLTWRKQVNDQTHQRQADRAQSETESLRRFDATFAQITSNLASDSTALQASAAAAILALQRTNNSAFEPAVLALLSAQVKLPHDEPVSAILIRALERVIRMCASATPEPDQEPIELWLANAQLARLRLAGLDLREVPIDVAFADLHSADFSDANLWRMRGFGVNLERVRASGSKLGEARLNRARCAGAQFHGSSLVAATLKGADLRGAEFQRAKLQSAHLEGSDLRGANFTDANLDDTYLLGARLDKACIASISRAHHWKSAWLDRTVRQQVEATAPAVAVS